MNRQRVDVGKGDNAMELPEDIIQHILSFLSPEEAAQMSLLSKTWYSAWSTFPVLTLHFDDIRYPASVKELGQEFMDYVKKSLQRYRNQNAYIQQLHLSIWRFFSGDVSSLIENVLRIIETAGAAKDLRFSYASRYALTEIFTILEAEKLTEFFLAGCKLRQSKTCKKKIQCCRLRTLYLQNVHTDEATLQSILSGCPLIENISLINCSGLNQIKVVNNMLCSPKELGVSLTIVGTTAAVEVAVQNLESLHIRSSTWSLSNLKLFPCPHLKKLMFYGLAIDEDGFFHDFVNKFPNLEVLSLLECFIYRKISISSNSIKSMNIGIRLAQIGEGPEVEIDAPSMVSFEYEGEELPIFNSLATANSSSRCKYRISIHRQGIFRTDRSTAGSDWSIQLKEMLKKILLNKSQVSLSIDFSLIFNAENLLMHLPVEEPGVEVEDLTLLASPSRPLSSYSTLIDNLFLICRPKSIILALEKPSCDEEFVKVFCQRMVGRRNSDNCDPGDHELWEEDLNEVGVDRRKFADISGWLPKKILFNLKWKRMLK